MYESQPFGQNPGSEQRKRGAKPKEFGVDSERGERVFLENFASELYKLGESFSEVAFRSNEFQSLEQLPKVVETERRKKKIRAPQRRRVL